MYAVTRCMHNVHMFVKKRDEVTALWRHCSAAEVDQLATVTESHWHGDRNTANMSISNTSIGTAHSAQLLG